MTRERSATGRRTVEAALPNLARIPAGDFLMGAADGGDNERPLHRVYVSEFFIGRFPVTHEEYARFVRATGHRAPGIGAVPLIALGDRENLFRDTAEAFAWRDGHPRQGLASHPVVLVTFDDAVAYCAWLGGRIGRAVRLPTEAEWEKAARGGVEGRRYPWGDDIAPSHGNYLVDRAQKAQRGTRPTGTYPPNGYGLYDMIGNAWEWVADWYAPESYGSGEARDPQGPDAGVMRIVRGGSWVNDDPDMLRSSYRHLVPPDTYSYSIGFRIVCSA